MRVPVREEVVQPTHQRLPGVRRFMVVELEAVAEELADLAEPTRLDEETIHLADHLLRTFPSRDEVDTSPTARTLGAA